MTIKHHHPVKLVRARDKHWVDNWWDGVVRCTENGDYRVTRSVRYAKSWNVYYMPPEHEGERIVSLVASAPTLWAARRAIVTHMQNTNEESSR